MRRDVVMRVRMYMRLRARARVISWQLITTLLMCDRNYEDIPRVLTVRMRSTEKTVFQALRVYRRYGSLKTRRLERR